MAKTGARSRAGSSSARAAKRTRRAAGGKRREVIESAPDTAVESAELEHLDFGPLAFLVGYRIRRAYGRVFQSFNEMFAPMNIAFGQFSVLTLIGLNPGLSQVALATASGIDRSTVVPITDRFVRMRWVRRSRRREDRRMYSLRLTPAGQAVLDRALKAISAHDEQIARSLSAAERAQLIELLARVNEERIPSLRPKHADPGAGS